MFDRLAKIYYNATMYKYCKVLCPLTRKRMVLGSGDTCGFVHYGELFTARTEFFIKEQCDVSENPQD